MLLKRLKENVLRRWNGTINIFQPSDRWQLIWNIHCICQEYNDCSTVGSDLKRNTAILKLLFSYLRQVACPHVLGSKKHNMAQHNEPHEMDL